MKRRKEGHSRSSLRCVTVQFLFVRLAQLTTVTRDKPSTLSTSFRWRERIDKETKEKRKKEKGGTERKERKENEQNRRKKEIEKRRRKMKRKRAKWRKNADLVFKDKKGRLCTESLEAQSCRLPSSVASSPSSYSSSPSSSAFSPFCRLSLRLLTKSGRYLSP